MADYFDERGIDGNAEENRLEIDRNNLRRLFADFNMFEEIGVANQSAPPASQNVVKDLPGGKIETNSDGQCQICLKEYEKDEVTKELPCKHSFHSACITTWLEKTNSCPLCRNELPTDDEFYEVFRKEKIRAKDRASDIEALHNSMFT